MHSARRSKSSSNNDVGSTMRPREFGRLSTFKATLYSVSTRSVTTHLSSQHHYVHKIHSNVILPASGTHPKRASKRTDPDDQPPSSRGLRVEQKTKKIKKPFHGRPEGLAGEIAAASGRRRGETAGAGASACVSSLSRDGALCGAAACCCCWWRGLESKAGGECNARLASRTRCRCATLPL